jgi:hypothetical protein
LYDTKIMGGRCHPLTFLSDKDRVTGLRKRPLEDHELVSNLRRFIYKERLKKEVIEMSLIRWESFEEAKHEKIKVKVQ